MQRSGVVATGAALWGLLTAIAGPAVAAATPITRTAQLAVAVAPADATVSFQIDPAHSGSLPGDSLAAPLAQRWARDLGGPVSYPLVVGSLAYVTVGDTASTNLYALNLADGSTAWGPIDLGGSRREANATYDNGHVIVDGGLMESFNALTGAREWVTDRAGGMPVGSGGLAFTPYQVLDESSQSVAVYQGFGKAPPLQEQGPPAVDANTAYVDDTCGNTWAFNSTGGEVWVRAGNCQGGVHGSLPSVYANHVYVRAGSDSVILNAADGTVAASLPPATAPAFDGTTAFLVTGGATTSLEARTLLGSGPLWTFAGDGKLSSAPIVVNGLVYVGSASGMVYGVDESTGSLVWSGNAGSAVSGSMDGALGVPITGLGAGSGMLLVPATNRLVAFANSSLAISKTTVRARPRLGSTARSSTVATSGSVAADVATAFQIDSAHSGVQPASPLVPPLKQRWSVDLSSGGLSYPLAAGGSIFVIASGCPPSSTGCTGPTLWALDAATGLVQWWGDLADRWAAATYDQGMLFVVTYAGNLYAISAQTGQLIWSETLPLQGEVGEFTSPPTASNGMLYVNGGICSGGCFSGGGGVGFGILYAIREKDGSQYWEQQLALQSDSAPALLNGGVAPSGAILLGDRCAGAWRYDWDGTQRWYSDEGCSGNGATAVLSGTSLYLRPGLSRAVDTGIPTTAFTADRTPVMDGGDLFVISQGILQAESATNNAIQWQFTGDGQVASAPVAANGVLYETSTSGMVYALDEATGTVVWSANAGSPISPPDEQNLVVLVGIAAAEGVLIVPASSRLTAFESVTPPPSPSPTPSSRRAAAPSGGTSGGFRQRAWAPRDTGAGGSPSLGTAQSRPSSGGVSSSSTTTARQRPADSALGILIGLLGTLFRLPVS